MDKLKDLIMGLQITSEPGCEDKIPLTALEYEQREADKFNSASGSLNAGDGYNCDICKNKGFIAKVIYDETYGDYIQLVSHCRCQKIRNAIHRLNRSGLKNIVKDYTFDKYETPDAWQQTIKTAALKFCKDEKNNWFFIGGQSGAGKTHICTAIAVFYIKNEKDCRYMLWRDEITKIKANVNEPEEYSQMMKELKKADVLYIDDLFKSGKGEDGKLKPPTAADINVAFEIINYRYNNPSLITIISSERTLAELFDIDEAIAGRIAERTKEYGYCINLKKDSSRNWRMKGLNEI